MYKKLESTPELLMFAKEYQYQLLKNIYLSDFREVQRRIIFPFSTNEEFKSDIKVDLPFGETILESKNILATIRESLDLTPIPDKWFRINDYDEFKLCIDLKIANIEEKCKKLKSGVPPIRAKINKEIRGHFDFAMQWILENKMERIQTEVLYHFIQLLPALVDQKVGEKLANMEINRLKDIRRALTDLNKYGILGESLWMADRKFWEMIWKTSEHRMKIYSRNGTLSRFYPELNNFNEFLRTANYRGKGKMFYSLVEKYGHLKSLYGDCNFKSTTVKRDIITKIGKSFGYMGRSQSIKDKLS